MPCHLEDFPGVMYDKDGWRESERERERERERKVREGGRERELGNAVLPARLDDIIYYK